jgi:dUTP pyrophosphatase
MKIKLDAGAKMPVRAHETDAGFDLFAMESDIVPARGSKTFDTGVHVEIPEGYVGYIKTRSSYLANYGLLTDGTIDSGYTGSIRVTLFNTTAKDFLIKAGEKIAQLVIQPCALPKLELVEELEETERGGNGFGSTGR